MTPVDFISGLTKPALLLAGGSTKSSSCCEYPPLAQLDEYVDSPLLIARSDPMAEASLPDMRARSRPGTAIAAMMPMMATTISSSMSVKPLEFGIGASLAELLAHGLGNRWIAAFPR